jgi:glycosyltransferase involved in cell wall biosynthesis
MLYYRLLGKRVLFTAHNVNAAKRDETDSWLNRASLRVQYQLSHRIFVHTELMKRQLIDEFDIRDDKVILIPYGINVTIPTTGVNREHARRKLGLAADAKVLLFFGQIAPYKGLDYLIQAICGLSRTDPGLRLVIAGKVKQGWDEYWREMQQAIVTGGIRDRVVQHIRFIQDDEIEPYFIAADALVLPYTYIFQSGVLFLAYSFGLPVLATDVGSLKEHIVEARTGFVCQPRNAATLAETIERYFSSDLCRNLETSRADIRRFASERHSWTAVGAITAAAYLAVQGGRKSRANGATVNRQNA